MKVNPEIWGKLNASKRTQDLRLSNTHQTLQRVAFITLQMADCLLNQKDPELDKTSLVSNAVDSIALLGHVANDIATFRREQIKPALREEYKQLCSADIAPGEWLFGEYLPKRLRGIKETNHLAQEVAINSTGKNYHGYTNRQYQAPKRFYSAENKGTTFYGKANKSQKPRTSGRIIVKGKLLSQLEKIKQSVSSFEEHLPNIKSHLKNECDNFRAGRVAQFYDNWQEHSRMIRKFLETFVEQILNETRPHSNINCHANNLARTIL